MSFELPQLLLRVDSHQQAIAGQRSGKPGGAVEGLSSSADAVKHDGISLSAPAQTSKDGWPPCSALCDGREMGSALNPAGPFSELAPTFPSARIEADNAGHVAIEKKRPVSSAVQALQDLLLLAPQPWRDRMIGEAFMVLAELDERGPPSTAVAVEHQLPAYGHVADPERTHQLAGRLKFLPPDGLRLEVGPCGRPGSLGPGHVVAVLDAQEVHRLPVVGVVGDGLDPPTRLHPQHSASRFLNLPGGDRDSRPAKAFRQYLRGGWLTLREGGREQHGAERELGHGEALEGCPHERRRAGHGPEADHVDGQTGIGLALLSARSVILIRLA